jgi:hypothetical protein
MEMIRSKQHRSEKFQRKAKEEARWRGRSRSRDSVFPSGVFCLHLGADTFPHK